MPQGDPIAVTKADRELSAGEIWDLSPAFFNRSWDGKELDFEAGFVLVSTPAYLSLAVTVHCELCFDRSLRPGHYAPNLWQQDVAELFLADSTTGSYQEFNLSPAGAWWSMSFSSNRHARHDYAAPEGVQGSTERQGGSWRGLLMIPRASLLMGVDEQTLRGNVAMIFGRKPRCFISWAALPGAQPDFHQSEYFVPLIFT